MRMKGGGDSKWKLIHCIGRGKPAWCTASAQFSQLEQIFLLLICLSNGLHCPYYMPLFSKKDTANQDRKLPSTPVRPDRSLSSP